MPVGYPPGQDVPDVEILVVENGFIIRHHSTQLASAHLTLPGRQVAAEITGFDPEELDHIAPQVPITHTYVALTWDDARDILDEILATAFDDADDDDADDDADDAAEGGPVLVEGP